MYRWEFRSKVVSKIGVLGSMIQELITQCRLGKHVLSYMQISVKKPKFIEQTQFLRHSLIRDSWLGFFWICLVVWSPSYAYKLGRKTRDTFPIQAPRCTCRTVSLSWPVWFVGSCMHPVRFAHQWVLNQTFGKNLRLTGPRHPPHPPPPPPTEIKISRNNGLDVKSPKRWRVTDWAQIHELDCSATSQRAAIMRKSRSQLIRSS